MKKILALGDSITNGYDGSKDLKIDNYPNVLSHILKVQVQNDGVNNAMITRNIYGDLPQRVRDTNFDRYQLTIIFYGTNDYRHREESLSTVLTDLKRDVESIHQQNPAMKIMGIVPMNRYDYGHNAEHIKEIGGYEFFELQDGIRRTYENLKVPVLDWRTAAPEMITDDNYKKTLEDAHLHPTSDTYHQMAQIIADFIQNKQLI